MHEWRLKEQHKYDGDGEGDWGDTDEGIHLQNCELAVKAHIKLSNECIQLTKEPIQYVMEQFDWPGRESYLVKIGRFCPISPWIVPKHIHDGEVGEVRHVGDLGDGLPDAPRQELVDDASPALDAGDDHPPQGDTPRQPGEPLIEARLVLTPRRKHDLVLLSQVRYAEDTLPPYAESYRPENQVQGLKDCFNKSRTQYSAGHLFPN